MVNVGELITTGMGIRQSLDALVNNLLKGNATVIGEWVTVMAPAKPSPRQNRKPVLRLLAARRRRAGN